MIRTLLGPPDRLKPNPVYRSAAPARLYETDRVIAAEGLGSFAVLRDKAERRSRAALRAADRRRAETLARVDGVSLSVPVVEWDVLARRAVAHRNRRDEERAGDRVDLLPTPARVADVDEPTLQRWMVNYLRHVLTVYDAESDELFGRVGRIQGTRRLRQRVYAAIALAYPELAGECRRQLQEREGEDFS
jgi:hypothetical protein